ncbi:MAG: hypothetical protein HZC37_15885 [Burkholderiales bacterium]|nr:hypothetical protein [Burkholderiales bacterium]
MHQEVISIIPPAPVREPRAADVAAHMALWIQRGVRVGTWMRQGASLVRRAGRAVWRALEEEGRRRAERELKLRGTSLAALEAAKVRALADLHERSDPRFAAELRAAAARHEVLHGLA